MGVKRTDFKNSLFCAKCNTEPMAYSRVGIYRVYEDAGGENVSVQAGDQVVCQCGETRMNIFTDTTTPFEVKRENITNYEPVNMESFMEEARHVQTG